MICLDSDPEDSERFLGCRSFFGLRNLFRRGNSSNASRIFCIARRREVENRCRVIKLTTRRVSLSNLHARISSHLVTDECRRLETMVGKKGVNDESCYFLLFSSRDWYSFGTKMLKFLFNRWIENVLTERKLKFLPIVETTGSVRTFLQRSSDYRLPIEQEHEQPRSIVSTRRVKDRSFVVSTKRNENSRSEVETRFRSRQKKKRSEINGNKKGGKKKERSEARATRS